MTTSYPAAVDTYTNPTATDELDDEIGTRTHSELGTNPKGAAADVKARILATETVANAALPTATAATTYQPLDSDLTAIAALSTTAYGRAFLALADAAAGRTALGLGTASTSAVGDFQPIDSDLTSIAALTTTAYGRAVLELANQAALVALLPSYQPLDADLTAVAALTTPDLTITGSAQKASNLSDLANTATAFTNIKQAASETATGVVELATNAEVATGTDTARAVTPAGAAAAYQPLDADLTAIAALSTTAYGRAVLALANQAALSALIDHGGAAGLSDDDHSQYVLVAGTRSTAQVVLQAGNAAHVPLVAKGAASQSGDLQQWQDSTGSVRAGVGATGVGTFSSLYSTYLQDLGGVGSYINMTSDGARVYNRTSAAYVPLVVLGMAAQSGNLQAWRDSAGSTLAAVSAAGNLVAVSVAVGSGTLTGTYIQNSTGTDSYIEMGTAVVVLNRTSASNVPLATKGMAAQSGNLHTWFDSAWATVASVSAAGLGTFAGVTLPGSTDRLKFGHADQAQTTVGAAGAASALPATPTKYFKVKDSGGTEYVIPAYAAA